MPLSPVTHYAHFAFRLRRREPVNFVALRIGGAFPARAEDPIEDRTESENCSGSDLDLTRGGNSGREIAPVTESEVSE